MPLLGRSLMAHDNLHLFRAAVRVSRFTARRLRSCFRAKADNRQRLSIPRSAARDNTTTSSIPSSNMLVLVVSWSFSYMIRKFQSHMRALVICSCVDEKCIVSCSAKTSEQLCRVMFLSKTTTRTEGRRGPCLVLSACSFQESNGSL